jgi:esterase/lipase superfamily enzyme
MAGPRRPRLRWAGIALAGLVAGCGARGSLTFDPDAAAVGSVETILVATSRDALDVQPIYGSGRDPRLGFARFAVSVPPDRAPGTVTYPKRSPPDPATDFLVVRAERLAGERAFVAALDSALDGASADARDATIFVHGFNTNFAEGLYRQAQLQHDLDRRTAAVNFAWPSAAKSLDYLYDLDSALFSRDALEATILAAGRSRADVVNLVAHSMGTFLLMDTLRTMARTGAGLDRIGGVVLISPDIEVAVFERQAPPVLARGVPIYVVVSRGDRALALSARLRGERDRLGSIRSEAELGGLDVTVIDVSDVKGVSALGHFKEATSPALIDYIRTLSDEGSGLLRDGPGPSLAERGVALIQEGADIVATPLTGP